jgi:flagellar protein FlaI
VNDVFRWDPKTDSYSYSGRSQILERLADRTGMAMDVVQEEMRHRKTVLDYMVKKNIRKYSEVGSVIRDYYADPSKVYEKARLALLSE